MRALSFMLTAILLTSCAHAPLPERTYPHAWTQAVPPRPVPPIQLASQRGDYHLGDLHGRWVWLVFGYGSCPDVCPTTLSYLARAYGQLADPSRVQVVFVSVDPTRDTPAKLAGMATFFHRDFQAVTGQPAQLRELAGSVGAAYRKDPAPRSDDGYTISHSNQIFVLDPEGRQVATYQPDADPAGLTADFNALTATR